MMQACEANTHVATATATNQQALFAAATGFARWWTPDADEGTLNSQAAIILACCDRPESAAVAPTRLPGLASSVFQAAAA